MNQVQKAVKLAIEEATLDQVQHGADMIKDVIEKYGSQPWALAGLAYTAGMAEGLHLQAEGADVNNIVPGYAEWLEQNNCDIAQKRTIAELVMWHDGLTPAEYYIIFRTACRIRHCGMTEEERAMIVEQTKGVITA